MTKLATAYPRSVDRFHFFFARNQLMSMYRKTLMAGIAAMALVSGYGGNPNASSSVVADESS